MTTVADIKRAVAAMKANDVGTIYVQGQRNYVWVRGRGWVNPGPLKKKLARNKKRETP